MATYNKYQRFVRDLAAGTHDLLGAAGSTAHTLKIALTNTAPNAATHAVLADIAEITAGNGYTAGGASVSNIGSETGGTMTLSFTNVVFTATGSIGPFRYAVLYNSTAAGGPLIGWWDHGSSISLLLGDTFTVAFDPSIITLA